MKKITAIIIIAALSACSTVSYTPSEREKCLGALTTMSELSAPYNAGVLYSCQNVRN